MTITKKQTTRDTLRQILKAVHFYSPLRWVYHELLYAKKSWPHTISAYWSRRLGVTQIKRNPELIVSLTSIPERLATLHLCLDSLLRQSLKPDRLILWLSESCEQNRPFLLKKNIPATLNRLQKRGVEIRWCKDIGSYRKIIPAIRAFPNALIVTADDDFFYPTHWLQDLYESYQKEPQYIHCHRAHFMKYDDSGNLLPYNKWDFLAPDNQGPSLDIFPTCGAGTLYAPCHLSGEVLNEEVFLQLCPKADDVWLKAMSFLNGILCKKVSMETCSLLPVRIPNNRDLSKGNVIEGGNNLQIQNVWHSYKINCS